MLVAEPAPAVIALDQEIAEADALTEGRCRDHPHAWTILSMPGIGSVLGCLHATTDLYRQRTSFAVAFDADVGPGVTVCGCRGHTGSRFRRLG
ncbi:hypothetical protein ACFV0T_38185 [Streptomyces sp. NPDC059582]|uniref:hypothetical protein n=1 Tax=Streptomyces sp. NPDC059582 TaxID=3346875 RepID=UPI0036866276